MKAYMTLFRLRFKRIFAYRTAAIAGIFTQCFFGFLIVMKFQSFYDSNTGTLPLSYHQTLNYIWLGQIFFAILPWTGDREIQGMIRTGHVVYEWLRPLDLYTHWFMRSTATRIASMLVRIVPFFLVVFLLVPKEIRMTGPSSAIGFVSFLCALTMGILVGSGIQTFITATTLTTISELGPDRMMAAIVWFFSGMVIPLPFFPDSWQQVISYTPFSAALDIPLKFYIGFYPIERLPLMLGVQLLWIVILVIMTQLIIEKARKRLEIMGG